MGLSMGCRLNIQIMKYRILFIVCFLSLFACSKKLEIDSTYTTFMPNAIIEHPMVGPDKYIVTMWCPPPADEATMGILKRDGYTLVSVGQLKFDIGEDPDGAVWSPEEYIKRLDIAQKYGLKVQIISRLFKVENLNNPSNLALISELIEKIKNHPALDSYFLTDEPGISEMSGWQSLYNYIKQIDPNHPGYINILPVYAAAKTLGVESPLSLNDPDWYSESLYASNPNSITIGNYNAYLKSYIEKVFPKLISYDNYNFNKKGKDRPDYFLNLALVRNAAVKTGIPFLNIVQACTIMPEWRVLNKNEIRWLAYTTMVYGGRGISWFLYWGPTSYGGLYQDGKRMLVADFVASVNNEISILGPELIQLNSSAVYQTSPLPIGTLSIPDNSPVKIKAGQFILGFFANTLTKNAFMVVNRDYKNSATAQLVLNYGNATLFRFNMASAKWIEEQKIQNGSILLVPLQQSEGALFKVIQE
jgi:hypothetical protein